MPRNIIMAASLPASPEKIFDMYLDAEAHAAFTGLPVTLEPHAGGLFRAFDGMLSGTILRFAEVADRSDLAVGELAAYGDGLGADANVLAGGGRRADRACPRQRRR